MNLGALQPHSPYRGHVSHMSHDVQQVAILMTANSASPGVASLQIALSMSTAGNAQVCPSMPPKSAHSRGVSELPPDVMFFGSTWVPNGTWTGSAAFVALSHNIVNNRSHFVLCMRCGLRTSVQILPALHTPDTFQWAGMSPSKVSLPTKTDFLEDQQSLMQAVLSCKNLTSKSAECIWFWGTKSALLLDPDRRLLYPRLPQNIPISFFS